MKNSIDTIGNRTRNLLACSTVPPHHQVEHTSTEIEKCAVEETAPSELA